MIFGEYCKAVYFKKNIIPMWIICKCFLYYMGVRNKSYMGNSMIRLFNEYFKNSNNLYLEYFFYYRREYNTFCDFIKNKHNLLYDCNSNYCSLFSYYTFNGHISDSNIDMLLKYDDIFKEIFWDFFGGQPHEDKNRICNK